MTDLTEGKSNIVFTGILFSLSHVFFALWFGLTCFFLFFSFSFNKSSHQQWALEKRLEKSMKEKMLNFITQQGNAK